MALYMKLEATLNLMKKQQELFNIFANNQAEFSSINFESLGKKIQLTHNKLRLVKRKGNKTKQLIMIMPS